MHMFYEIVITMQIVHLNCRKGPVKPPTRKEGWDLFQRTSDENSKFTLINMNLKLPRSETPWRKKELQRVVDPPRNMKTWVREITQDEEKYGETSKRPQTHSSCVTNLGDIIDANISGYERSYDQRVTVDHGERCIQYGFKT